MTKTKPKEMEVQIYKSKDGVIQMEVRLKKDTVWLTQLQISQLFDVNVPAIWKHISNIYRSHELSRESTLSKMEIVQDEGGRSIIRNSTVYNLDVIISVGYRVNSLKATQFRIWATKVLKQHLLQGYSINEKLLMAQKDKLNEIKSAINFIEDKSHQELLRDQTQELLLLVRQYTKSIDLLDQYDQRKIRRIKGQKQTYSLAYEDARRVIDDIKRNLSDEGKNVGFFGIESSDKLRGIIENLNQTFDGKELYRTIEEKAANLIYMIIKDHPLIDGNKRSGSILFIYYLDKNNLLYRTTGERIINENGLVALALLIAVSNPNEKEILIKVITSLLTD